MDISTRKRNVKGFIEKWKDRGREKQDSQSFWLSLLRDVLGVEKPEKIIRFEEKVKLAHDSFIDGYIDQTHTMIEQTYLKALSDLVCLITFLVGMQKQLITCKVRICKRHLCLPILLFKVHKFLYYGSIF